VRLAPLRDPVTLAVGALAVHRLTRLAVEDELTRPGREAVAKWAEGTAERVAWPRLAYFVTCPWCVSVWLAAGWAVLTVTCPPVAQPLGAVLAWSSATGLISSVT
jgi:Protein of unknown function (DUF1360)